MTGKEKHTRGIVATIVFHACLILLLVLFGFHTPLPLPEEQAILINFGTDNTGGGLVEPAPAPPASTPPPPAKETPKKETQQPKEEIVTQDLEKAAAVESGKKKEPDKPTPEELKKKKQEEEAKKKAREEAERKRKAAEEAKRKAEEERKRKEEERKRREAEERKKQQAQQLVKNAFSQGQGVAATTSEGETGGKGNQGVKEGSPQAGAHSGTPGGGGNGISYDLSGRKPLSLPKPEYNGKEEGKVVVEVTVDRNGNVTKANPGVQGSTTLNEYLLSVAKKAALASKFDRKPDAPAYQKGTITYVFIQN